jgi:hypothetical protein
MKASLLLCSLGCLKKKKLFRIWELFIIIVLHSSMNRRRIKVFVVSRRTSVRTYVFTYTYVYVCVYVCMALVQWRNKEREWLTPCHVASFSFIQSKLCCVCTTGVQRKTCDPLAPTHPPAHVEPRVGLNPLQRSSVRKTRHQYPPQFGWDF